MARVNPTISATYANGPRKGAFAYLAERAGGRTQRVRQRRRDGVSRCSTARQRAPRVGAGRRDALSDIARRTRAMDMDTPLEFHRCRQQAGSIDAMYCVNYAP